MNGGTKGNPNYYVKQTNPEIFTVTPRPGGLAKIDVPPKVNKLKERVRRNSTPAPRASRSRSRGKRSSEVKSVPEPASAASRKSILTITSTYEEPKDLDADAFPKRFKVKQITQATPWSVEFDEYLETPEDAKKMADPFQDSVDMLAMTVSVIMLMARNNADISNSHYKWVLSYLDCIKDEFGHPPPNVQGILNHIKKRTEGQIKSFLDDDFDEKDVDAGKARISPNPPEVEEID